MSLLQRVVWLLIATAVATGCGVLPDGEPATVTLAELVAEQEELDGDVVVAEGIVRTYDDPRHYWIEDADLNRVEIVPEAAIASHVGARVQVEGRFTFREDEGRRISVDRVEVLEAANEEESR